MKRTTNSIFSDPGPITRDDLVLYAQGKLRGEKLHKVEEWIAENGMEAEAIEGILPDPSALSVLPEKAPFSKNSSSAGSLFTIVITIAVISTSLLIYTLVKPVEGTVRSIAETAEAKQTIPEETVTEQIQEIEEAEPIEIKEQITYAKTIKNQPVMESKTANSQLNEPENIPEIKPENISEKKTKPLDITSENKVAYSNVKFKYIVDLKIIDYSNLYTSGIERLELDKPLTGLTANYENEESKKTTEPEIRTVYVPYEEFLRESLEHFKNNDYKTALKNFKIIHQHYPEDLNAFFYGGLCYYNLNKCEKAIIHFDKCINGSYNTFLEEAEWYKALSLHRCRKKDEALLLLQSIKDANGFYSGRAQEMISNEK